MEKDKDYYIVVKNGVEFRVLTEEYLAKRGWCCGSGCVNCPYTPRHVIKGNTELREDIKKKLN